MTIEGKIYGIRAESLAAVTFRIGHLPCAAFMQTAEMIINRNGYPGHTIRATGAVVGKSVVVENVEVLD